jgi:hypothetical protein
MSKKDFYTKAQREQFFDAMLNGGPAKMVKGGIRRRGKRGVTKKDIEDLRSGKLSAEDFAELAHGSGVSAQKKEQMKKIAKKIKSDKYPRLDSNEIINMSGLRYLQNESEAGEAKRFEKQAKEEKFKNIKGQIAKRTEELKLQPSKRSIAQNEAAKKRADAVDARLKNIPSSTKKSLDFATTPSPQQAPKSAAPAQQSPQPITVPKTIKKQKKVATPPSTPKFVTPQQEEKKSDDEEEEEKEKVPERVLMGRDLDKEPVVAFYLGNVSNNGIIFPSKKEAVSFIKANKLPNFLDKNGKPLQERFILGRLDKASESSNDVVMNGINYNVHYLKKDEEIDSIVAEHLVKGEAFIDSGVAQVLSKWDGFDRGSLGKVYFDGDDEKQSQPNSPSADAAPPKISDMNDEDLAEFLDQFDDVDENDFGPADDGSQGQTQTQDPAAAATTLTNQLQLTNIIDEEEKEEEST